MTSIPSQGSPKAPVEEGASRETLNRIEAKQRQELARFQAISGQRIPSCIKMLSCKTNLNSVHGRSREEGEGKRRRRGGEKREEGDS